MAATLEAVKLALSALPNIELVSLLVALYGYVFGPCGVLAAVIFVGAEILIWGVNTWVISYLIYWPLLAILFWLLGKKGVSNRFTLTGIIIAMTAFFGVLTSLIDIGLFTGYWNNFWGRFTIYYMRGIWFYVTHVVSNTIIFITLFKPLATLFQRLKRQFYKNTTRN